MSTSNIHGFRTFYVVRCSRTGDLTLAGSAGMHLHSRVQRPAECRGISHAMWMTQTARDRLAAYAKPGSVPHEEPSPDWDCTCGHYFFRTFADAWTSHSQIYVHVTCLERTVLHTGGGRTTQYAVDYLLLPEKTDTKVYVALVNSGLIANQWGYFGMPTDSFVQTEVMEEIAASLGVPILERHDMGGCPNCLLANGWRKESEITSRMRHDWFGEGYKE